MVLVPTEKFGSDSDENFKPEHTLFCRKLRFVAIYALLFGDLWAKKVPFWVKTVLFGQEVHHYMVYIAYFTELNLQICGYAQKRRISCKNCKCALDGNFHGHFCPPRKAAKFCHPEPNKVVVNICCSFLSDLPADLDVKRKSVKMHRATHLAETKMLVDR